MGNITSLLPLIVLAALFYLLLIRPQKNKQRQAQALLSKLSAGDRVMTSSGIYGTVVLIDGDDVEVEVYPDVDIRFVKGAIQRILPPEEGADAIAGDDAAALDSDLTDDDRDDSVPVVRPTAPTGSTAPAGSTASTDSFLPGATVAPDPAVASDSASPGVDRR